jgi:hypothetical protein
MSRKSFFCAPCGADHLSKKTVQKHEKQFEEGKKPQRKNSLPPKRVVADAVSPDPGDAPDEFEFQGNNGMEMDEPGFEMQGANPQDDDANGGGHVDDDEEPVLDPEEAEAVLNELFDELEANDDPPMEEPAFDYNVPLYPGSGLSLFHAMYVLFLPIHFVKLLGICWLCG